MFVYFAINEVNLKMYIGKSLYPQERWKDHISEARRGCKYAFHRAIRKYGIGAFYFDILEQCETEEKSLGREMYWIKVYDTLIDNGKGYNMTLGGEGIRLCPSELAKIKQRCNEPEYLEKLRARCNTPEYIEQSRERLTSLWSDEDFKQKRYQACTSEEFRQLKRVQSVNHWNTPGSIEKFTERMNNPETVRLLSEGAIARWSNPEFKIKMQEALATPEAKENHRNSIIDLWQTPEFRTTRAQAMASPEVKQRMRDGMLRRYDTPERRERDLLILDLRSKGMSVKNISLKVNLSESGVYKVINKAKNEKN